MYDIELREYLRSFEEYLEHVKKNETPEESRDILIETGVIDESGKFIIRHGDYSS